jgi:hypothetical protein
MNYLLTKLRKPLQGFILHVIGAHRLLVQGVSPTKKPTLRVGFFTI